MVAVVALLRTDAFVAVPSTPAARRAFSVLAASETGTPDHDHYYPCRDAAQQQRLIDFLSEPWPEDDSELALGSSGGSSTDDWPRSLDAAVTARVRDLFNEESDWLSSELATSTRAQDEILEHSTIARQSKQLALPDSERAAFTNASHSGIVQRYHDQTNHAEAAITNQHGLKTRPSHELVELTEHGRPAKLTTADLVFVDEERCIGCGVCESIAPATFFMETERGRGRAFEQRAETTRASVDKAIEECPTQCIHHVTWDELKDLEEIRDEYQAQVLKAGKRARKPHAGLLCNHCFGTSSCPAAGCFNCPAFAHLGTGANPAFAEKEERDAKAQRDWRHARRKQETDTEL